MESQNDKQPEIPSTFTRHFGEATPALEYNTPIAVCYRNGEVEDGILDDFDFEAKHEGYLSEIVGYRLRSVSVAEEQKDHPLGSLGRAFGVPYVTLGVHKPDTCTTPLVIDKTMTYSVNITEDGKPDGYGITNLGPVTNQPSQYKKELAMHPMDAQPTPKATRDNIAIAATTPPYVTPLQIEQQTVSIKPITSSINDYQILTDVLHRAYQQAAHGKGRERHAKDQPFDKQPMQTISQLVGSSDGLRYQAIKKIQEAGRMDKDAAVRELLGAINYIAGTIIYMESEK